MHYDIHSTSIIFKKTQLVTELAHEYVETIYASIIVRLHPLKPYDKSNSPKCHYQWDRHQAVHYTKRSVIIHDIHMETHTRLGREILIIT